MECYSALKKENLTFDIALINLGDIKLSEIRQTQMNKYCLKYMGARKVDFLRSRE